MRNITELPFTLEQKKENIVRYIQSSPPNSIMVLLSEHDDELLKFIFDHFPLTSPIMFEHSLSMSSLQKLVRHIKSKRCPSAILHIAFDAKSSKEQVEYLISEFKSFEAVFFSVIEQSYTIIPPGVTFTIDSMKYRALTETHIPESVAMPKSTLESICKTITAGQNLILNQQLRIADLNQFIPHLGPDVHLMLPETVSLDILESITHPQLVKPEVWLSMPVSESSIENRLRAECFAKRIKPMQRLIVRQDFTPVDIAQILASNLSETAILYCLSGDIAYVRAIAKALKPGAALMLHSSMSFQHLLTASEYLRPGTGLSIDLELDDVQIDLLVKNLSRGVIYMVNAKAVSAEELVADQLNSKISSSYVLPSEGLGLQSFFHHKVITDIEKLGAFLTDQLQLEGKFHLALPEIVNQINLLKVADDEDSTDEYQVIRYFIDKYQKNTTYSFDSKLEQIVTQFGFNILVNFDNTLSTIYSNVYLSEKCQDMFRKQFLELLDNLKCHHIPKVDSLRID